MKKLTSVCVALAALLTLAGCSTAWVSNEARCKTTLPDGTVEERFAQNKIKAFGDRAVEQNLKGSLADATEADLSAGIQESAQKSESGAVVEFMGRTVETLGKIGEAYLTRGAPAIAAPPPAATNACVGEDCVDPAAPVDAGESEIVYSNSGYDGVPAETGEGVYGRPNCPRCRAYKANHPEAKVINIDLPANRQAMLKALDDRKFPDGTRIEYPVLITADAYVSPAK